MTDPIVTPSVITPSLLAILKTLKEPFKDVFDEVQQFLNKGINKYLEEQWNRHAYIKTLLHRTNPKYIYDLYQPQKLKYKDTVIHTDSTDNLFGSTNKVIVLGEAGSGKSTLVKHLFLKTIEEQKYIPIIIELRYLDNNSKSLIDYLKDITTFNSICKNSKIFERLLKSGKFVFFFDGYDEIKSDKKEKLTKEIIDFADNYNENKFVLTSRPFANIDLIQGFYTMTIKPLENDEVSEFVKKQIDEKELQGKIINSIQEHKPQHINSFLTNPLLLSMYILIFRRNAGIPQKKYIFYRNVLNALFSEHDALSKVGYEQELHSNLSQEDIEIVMQKFAILSFSEEKILFDEDYVNTKFTQIKNKTSDIDFDNKALINDLKQNIGIWVEDGGLLSFAHKSIQEYFAALHMLNLDENKKQEVYEKLFSKKQSYQLRHFASICEEMDKVKLYKYIYHPIIQDLLSELDLSSNKAKFVSIIHILNATYEVRSDRGGSLGMSDKYISFLSDYEVIPRFNTFLLSVKIMDCLKKDEIFNFLKTNNLLVPSLTDNDTKEIQLTFNLLNQIGDIVPKDDDYSYIISFVDMLVQKEQEIKRYLAEFEQASQDFNDLI